MQNQQRHLCSLHCIIDVSGEFMVQVANRKRPEETDGLPSVAATMTDSAGFTLGPTRAWTNLSAFLISSRRALVGVVGQDAAILASLEAKQRQTHNTVHEHGCNLNWPGKTVAKPSCFKQDQNPTKYEQRSKLIEVWFPS